MITMPDTPLRGIRERAHISREDIVRRGSQVSMATIRNAEKGARVKYQTGVQILTALNSLLAERGYPIVTLDDLGLDLR